MKLKIGSRASRLAVKQTQWVMDRIAQGCPGIELELVTITTTGDRILHKTLEQIGGKGLFVQELEQALRDGTVDLTVHSLKDLPMETDPALPLVAFTPREDPRDVLVLPQGVTELDSTGPIGCASKRRAYQLRALYPGCEVRPVRGNVQTRLGKLDSGQYAALVLAAAGLRRLGLEARISRYFSTEEMVPAAGQGILAVQGRGDLPAYLFSMVRDPDAAACARAERAFVRTLNGGCTAPTAAYAERKAGCLTLTGLYVSEDGACSRRGCLSGPPAEAEQLGIALARRLKEESP